MVQAYKKFSNHPIVELGGRKVRDFTRAARIFPIIREDDNICADYIVQEGETAQMLAQDFYGDPNLFWVLMNLNDVVHPWFDWPMAYNDLIRYTRSKYELASNADVYNTAYYGFDDTWYATNRLNEALLDNPQFATIEEFQSADGVSPMSYIEFEGMLNDERRLIRVVRPEEIDRVVNDYRKEIRA